MPNVSNDLSQKLYATMEKHKEVGTAPREVGTSMWIGIMERNLDHNLDNRDGEGQTVYCVICWAELGSLNHLAFYLRSCVFS